MNIFKKARFGDKFVTRNGRLVVFLGKSQFRHDSYEVKIEGESICRTYRSDGSYFDFGQCDGDIIGRWKEDKDLDALAEAFCPSEQLYINADALDVQEAYKAGFRKAKELWKL